MATTTAGPTQTAKTEVETGRWAASKWVSRVLRAVIFVAPFVISILLSFWASRNFPPERLGVNRWVWWIGLIVIATVVVRVIEKLLARLTPVTMLFRLSLVFPDQAPSRFSVVLKAGSPRAVQRRLDEIEANGMAFTKDDTYASQMLELISLLSSHDRMTRGHAERVRAYSELIGEEMGLDEEELAKLRWGALLHDMGKLDVPSEILNKPSRPTDEEWKILQTHPAAAEEYLEPLALWLGEWRHAATGHHERWDGGGYPLGLAGEEIPLSARIVGVADAFDVMTSTRSYKSAMSLDLGRQEVADKAGSQFDPAVARAFLRVSLGDLRRISGPLAWFAGLPGLQNIPVGSIASSATTVATGVSAVTLGVTAPFVGNTPPIDPPTPPPAVGFIEEAPELEIVAPAIPEDTSGTIELTIASDTPTTITIALDNPPATVESSPSEDGKSHELLVTPDPNYAGSFPVTVEVCNENELCTTETFDVTVVPTNDPPEIAFGRLTIEDNTTARLDITDVNSGAAVANGALPIYVRDVDGDIVRLVGVEGVTGGTASHTDATIEFTHDPASTAAPAMTAVFSDGTTTVRRRIELDLIITNVAPTISPASFSIAENTGTGAAIGTVVATDDDGDALTFSIDPPIAEIVINPLTGELAAAVSLNHEARSTYTFTVAATDPRGASSSADVSVSVTDVAEPLAFGPLPTLAISEEATAGTPIGTISAFDPDGGAVTFTATTGGPFAIDSTTGLITATSPPPVGTTTIVVTATSTDGESISVSLPITVADVNHAPEITAPNFTILVNEVTPVGTDLGAMSASDSDGDAVTFATIGGDSPTVVSIDAVTGKIVLAEALDYESKTQHTVLVRATDNGSPVLSDTKEVRIGVVDTNEAPVLGAIPAITLPEVATPVGATIATLTASDPEGGPITFTGIDPTGSLVVAADGTVTVASSLDFETNPTIPLTVVAKDLEGGSTTAVMTVVVTGENEPPVFDTPNAVVTAPEGTAPGSSLAFGSATDPDAGDVIAYRIISGDPTSTFTIDPATGEVLLATTLDYESIPSFTLTIGASDGSIESTTELKITVGQVDEPPTITAPTGFAARPENTTGLIETVVASDPEGDAFSFAIDSGDPGGLFDLDPVTGAFSIVGVLDYETSTMHSLVVRVSQDSDPSLTTTAPFDLTVLPVNEAPVFDTPNANLFPLETTIGGTLIGSASATDPDAGDTIVYRIVSGDPGGEFTIDPSTGDLATATTTILDKETTPLYSLVIGADDGSIESSTTYTITVDDVDEAPIIIGPAAFSDRPEDQPLGLLETIAVFDPEGDGLTFTIDSGNPAGLFDLDATTGELSLVAPLDYETTTLHTLVISATQTDDVTLLDTATFTLTVLPINEAPVFDVPDQVVTPLEGTPGGTPLGSVTATDPDVGDTIVYRIVSGDPGGHVTIDPSTGDIATATTLDAETTPTYPLVIGADDGAIESTTTFTVNVGNIDEPPIITGPAAFTNRPEDQPLGLLETVSAVDPEGDSIIFTIDSGDPGGLFDLDPSTGELSLVATLDADTTPLHTLVIKATQSSDATLFDTKAFDLVVDPIDEAPILTVPPTLELEEGATDPIIGVIGASDEELETLTFAISDPNFTIDATGTIRAVDTTMFDFETPPNSYPMTVTVTDEADPDVQTTTAAITIDITDANENPVVTPAQSYIVIENDPNAPISVVPVAATDVDAGDSIVSYAVTGGTGAGLFTIDGTGIISKAAALDFNAAQSYDLEVTVTDTGGLTGIGTVTIDVQSRFGPTPSPYAGQVIVNEVMYRNGGTADWLELVNLTDAPIDTSTWTITDSEDGAGEPTFTMAGPAIPLAPGDHVLVQEPGIEFAHIDDVFLFDDAGLLVAYLAWGDSAAGGSEIVSRPPLAVWPLWDTTHETELGGSGNRQSISLSPDAGTARSSACWELTTTGTSVGRCPGAEVTLDTTTGGNVSSRWTANTPPREPVISELGVGGMHSDGDFVEIYNPSPLPINITGYELWLYDGGGVPAFTIPLDGTVTTFMPGQHLFTVEGTNTHPIAPDANFPFITAQYGIAIWNGTQIVDSVGNAPSTYLALPASPQAEGVGLADPLAQPGFDQSFERLIAYGQGNCVDTDNNAADFTRNFIAGAANPQNSTDAVVPCGSEPVTPGPADHMIINEFRTDGPNSGSDEFIELFNPHSTSINLFNYTLVTDAGVRFTFPADVVAPGEHYLLFGPTYSGPGLVDGWHNQLSNSTAWIELRDGSGVVLQHINIASGGDAIPQTFNRYEATWQRRDNGCTDFAQEDLNWGWSSLSTPMSLADPATPCP